MTHRPPKTSSPATDDAISERHKTSLEATSQIAETRRDFLTFHNAEMRHKTSLETSQIADGKRDFLTSQIADLKRDFQIGEMRPPPAPPADRERHRSRFETIYS